MRLKEYLNEGMSISAQNDEVKKWLNRCGVGEKVVFHRNTKGSVEILGTVPILDESLIDGKLPDLNISEIYELNISALDFNSFENFPEYLGANKEDTALTFFGYDHLKITSFEHISPNIHGGVFFTRLPNVNYSKCNRYIKRLDGSLEIHRDYVGPILSVFLIKDLEDFWLNNIRIKDKNNELNDLIEKMMKTDRDILDCQEELIQAGYKEYAKL